MGITKERQAFLEALEMVKDRGKKLEQHLGASFTFAPQTAIALLLIADEQECSIGAVIDKAVQVYIAMTPEERDTFLSRLVIYTAGTPDHIRADVQRIEAEVEAKQNDERGTTDQPV